MYQLQEQLNTWLWQQGEYEIAVDGVFGSETREAVLFFQEYVGIYPDGIVGAETVGILEEEARAVPTYRVPRTASRDIVVDRPPPPLDGEIKLVA